MKRLLLGVSVFICLQYVGFGGCYSGDFTTSENREIDRVLAGCNSIEQMVMECDARSFEWLCAVYERVWFVLTENSEFEGSIVCQLTAARNELLDRCPYLSVKLNFYRRFRIESLYSIERRRDNDYSTGCVLLGVKELSDDNND